MNTTPRTLLTSLALWLMLLLSSCVTSVDDALPYTRLPEITLASPVRLVASPSHPTAYLSSDPIPAGRKVQVIGADENMAWLLVLNGQMLGWMPAFIAETGVAKLTPAVVFEPLDGECIQFLGATFDIDKTWTNVSRGDFYVLGSIYRPKAGTNFDRATLSINVSGGGAVVDSDYLHTPLTRNSAVIFFAYSVRGGQHNSRLNFDAQNLGGENVLFQALFFRNNCTQTPDLLPIGIVNTTIQRGATVKEQTAVSEPTATATPIIRESGPPSSHHFDIAFTRCEGNNCDIYLKIDGDDGLIQLTDDPASDSSPSWSPAGDRFVFQSDRSGVDQLYIYDMERRRVVAQITNSANSKGYPKWSPNGDEVIYQEGINNKWDLWKVNLISMKKQRLTSIGLNLTPSWSPDGDKISFSAARLDTNGDGAIDFDDDRHIWVMNSDGTNLHSITNESQYYDQLPSWMPDGNHIVFRRRARKQTGGDFGPSDIYMVNLSTKNAVPLTFSSTFESYAVPSPTGDQFLIVVYEEDGNKWALYLANWDGKQLSEFTRISEGFSGAWRPSPASE